MFRGNPARRWEDGHDELGPGRTVAEVVHRGLVDSDVCPVAVS